MLERAVVPRVDGSRDRLLAGGVPDMADRLSEAGSESSVSRAWHRLVRRSSSGASGSKGRTRFAVGVMLAGLLIAFGLAWFAGDRISDLVMTMTAERAIDQVDLGVNPLVESADFEPPFSQGKLNDLANRLDPSLTRLEEEGIIRLNVVAPDGTIIYSDRPSIRGLQIPLDEPFLKALTGSDTRQVVALTGSENVDLQSRFGEALEVHVPVTIRGRVVGVYEVYEDLGGTPAEHPPLVWASTLGVMIPWFLLLFIVARQATQLMSREHAARDLQEQYQAQAEALRAMTRVEGEMLSSVSHELRDPLSLVHGYAELLANRPRAFSPEEVRQIAGEINRGSRLMSRIVDDLLDFNRVGRGSLRLELREIDLVAVVTNTIEIFAPQIGFDRLLVEAPRSLMIVGDPQRLSQVTANLISNALRYAPTGPVRVRVASEPDGRASIQVRDYGPGISPEALPHLWEMFYRAPEVIESQVAGSGIGLALVKHIVEAHGGSVEVDSKPGEGATFRVYLPRRREQSPDSSVMPGSNASDDSELIRIAERIASAEQSSSQAIRPDRAITRREEPE